MIWLIHNFGVWLIVLAFGGLRSLLSNRFGVPRGRIDLVAFAVFVAIALYVRLFHVG